MEYFLFITILASIAAYIKKFKPNLRIALLIILWMIFLCGFRDISVGRDTINYLDMFSGATVSERIEPIFRYLIVVYKRINLSYQFFLLTVAIIVYLPLFLAIKKWSTNPCLSLLVYITFSVFFFTNSYNVLRNAIAASFGLLAILYFNDEKYKKSGFYYLIAIGFHYSAILILPLALIAKSIKKISPLVVGIALIISIIIGLTSSIYTNIFSELLTRFSLLSGAVSENYTSYMDNIAEIELNTNGIIMLLVPMSLVSFFTFFINDKNYFLKNILFLGAVIGNLFVSVLYAYRLTIYFTLVVIILYPNIITKTNHNKFTRIGAISLIITMISYFIYMLYMGTTPNLLPYKFCFE